MVRGSRAQFGRPLWPFDDARCNPPKSLEGEVAVVVFIAVAVSASLQHHDRGRHEVRRESDPELAVAEADENQFVCGRSSLPLGGFLTAGLGDALYVHGERNVGVDDRA